MTDTQPGIVPREHVAYKRVALALHVLFVVVTLGALAASGGITATVVACFLGAAIFGGWALGMLRAEQNLRMRHIEMTRPARPVVTSGWVGERPPGPRATTPGVPVNPIRPPGGDDA